MPGPRAPRTHPARQSRLALPGRRSGGGSAGAGGRGWRRPRPRPRPRHCPGCPDLPTSPPRSGPSVRTASHPHVRPQARLPAVRPLRASPRFLFPAGSPGPGSAGSGRSAHTCPASGRGGAGGTRTLTPSCAPPHTFSRPHGALGTRRRLPRPSAHSRRPVRRSHLAPGADFGSLPTRRPQGIPVTPAHRTLANRVLGVKTSHTAYTTPQPRADATHPVRFYLLVSGNDHAVWSQATPVPRVSPRA